MKKGKLYSARVATELSVFIENRPGTLRGVIDILRDAGVNMQALSMSEGQDAGYVRILADDPEKTAAALVRAGHLLRTGEILVIEVADEPGGMAAAIDRLAQAGINIDYAYSADGRVAGHSLIAAKVQDPRRALSILRVARPGSAKN